MTIKKQIVADISIDAEDIDEAWLSELASHVDARCRKVYKDDKSLERLIQCLKNDFSESELRKALINLELI